MTTPICMIAADPRSALALFKRIGEGHAAADAEALAAQQGERLRKSLLKWALPGVQRTPVQRWAADPNLS